MLILTLNRLIRIGAKGTTQEYANRLGVSRSTLFRLLEYIREELNAPVTYDFANRRYVYQEEGSLFFGFLPYRVLSKEDLKKINGGDKLYMPFRPRPEKIY